MGKGVKVAGFVLSWFSVLIAYSVFIFYRVDFVRQLCQGLSLFKDVTFLLFIFSLPVTGFFLYSS